MLRLLSDEDVHDDLIRGLRRREPALDIVRAIDVRLGRTPDPEILAWAASNERVLIVAQCYAPEEIKHQVLYIPL